MNDGYVKDLIAVLGALAGLFAAIAVIAIAVTWASGEGRWGLPKGCEGAVQDPPAAEAPCLCETGR